MIQIHEDSSDCWCEPRVIMVAPTEPEELGRVVVHHPWEWRQFTAFRRDGWPLCPRCGEDELWTPWTPPADQEAGLDDYVANKLSCYACMWVSA